MKNYFKITLSAIMLFAVTLGANAQFSSKADPSEPDRTHMGIRAGFSTNSVKDYSSLAFFQGGIAMDFQIAPIPLFLETGVYYMNKGSKFKDLEGYENWNVSQWENWAENYDRDEYDDTQDDHYIYAPLLFSYHINVAPNLFIQPFLGATFGYLTESEDFESAFRFGCGVNWKRLYLNVGYDVGLKNHGGYTIDGVKYDGYKNNTFFVTLGFNWLGSK